LAQFSTLTFLLLSEFFPSAFCATFGVNIYVSEKMTWSDARAYCRKHHTDLTSTDSQEESEELLMLQKDDDSNNGWIGLHKDDNGTWRWSGGKNTLFPLWISLQELFVDRSCVIQSERGWQMRNCEEKFPFYCFQSSLTKYKNLSRAAFDITMF
uniref:C-type lectin domain-containing protein n=1 Tax=Kryptolebias marmoratus TaxID=37003 RepID=A0A3Q3B1M8_KRYMA